MMCTEPANLRSQVRMTRTLAQFASLCGGQLHGSTMHGVGSVATDLPYIGVVIDSRKVARGDLFLALPGEHVDGHDYVGAAALAGAAGAVVARLVPAALPQIVVADVASALATAGGVWRTRFAGPVIGVAGSNGKTTTKEMLAAILAECGPCLATQGNLNNHLGVPLTLLRLNETQVCAVIEMGANRAGDVADLAAIAKPNVGLITNAGAEHLEGFGTLEGVARAEGEMVAGLGQSDVAVINADDVYADLWRGLTRARVMSFGTSLDADVRAVDIRLEISAQGFLTHFRLHCRAGRPATATTATGTAAAAVAAAEVPVTLAVAGRHNVLNALAAAAAALAVGVTLEQVATGLAKMRAVAGRLQFKALAGGAWLIDDSYNANPSSVEAALAVLAEVPGERWMVLGDMAELGDHAAVSHRDIGHKARQLGVARLFTFGVLAALAAPTFGVDAESYTDIEALVHAVRARLGASRARHEVRVLVKGSRVNRLERLVTMLTDVPTPPATPARRAT